MAFEGLAEDLRAADAIKFIGYEDSLFWRDLGYAFQLHGDPKTSGVPIVFPLVLNPKSYRKRFPFAVELTPVQEGGIVVEGQGIVLGEISIAGNFGFAPKAVDGIGVPLSGPAHFKRLQDQCFGRFSELRKDPSVQGVFLTWHALQDNEHYIVEPRDEMVERDVGRARFTYDYSYNLAVVGLASKLVTKAPEDDPVLQAIAAVHAAMVKALGGINGAIQDLQNQNPKIFGAIKLLQEAGNATIDGVRSVEDAITDAQQLAAATSEFLRGAKRVISLPVEVIGRLDDALNQIAITLARADNFPGDVVQSFRQIQDGVLAIGAYPERFKADFDEAGRRFLTLVQGPAGATQNALDAAASSNTEALSAGLQPGDSTRVDSGVFPTGRTFPRYQGFIEAVVLAGDTLPLIAARYLNDARRWIDLAVANDLKPPYISDLGLPDTMAAGDFILVPQLAANPALDSVRSAGNPELGSSQYEALLGTDLRTEVNEEGLRDLVVDESTLTDFANVSGVDNMKQAVDKICSTEKGENPLFLQLGIPSIVGQKGTFERLIEAHLAVASGVERDPRVTAIERLRFIADDDVVAVDFDVVLIQNIQTRVIGRALS